VAVEGLVAVAKRIDKLADATVSDKATNKLANAVGLMAKASVQMTGAASLGGDYKFSRWPKASELQVKYQLTKKPGGVVIHRAPRSAGPWRVAEEGVKAQTKGDKLEAGFRKNKNGTVVQKYKKSKRTTKGTGGQGSWTAFEAIVIPKASKLLVKELRQAFIRGIS
jgi:hypothetical protein